MNECIFLGYLSFSKACRFYNKQDWKVEESINVKFDKSNRLTVEGDSAHERIEAKLEETFSEAELLL